MSHWNYRIIRFKDKTCRNGWFYKVCEVYYNDNGEPDGYCDAHIGGETIKECFEEIMTIASDMAKAYLREQDIIGNQPNSNCRGKPKTKHTKSTKKVKPTEPKPV